MRMKKIKYVKIRTHFSKNKLRLMRILEPRVRDSKACI
jgi:hypothetical protein